MKIQYLIDTISQMTLIDKKIIKDLMNSDYFRNFKTKNDVRENSFTFNCLQKYKENMFDHYSDEEYLLAGLFFYKINGRNCVSLFKKIDDFFDKKFIDHKERNILQNCKSIVDLGAGIGSTTADLCELFVNSKVYYHNLEGLQFDFAKAILQNYKNANLIKDYSNIGEADLVFSLDYFEHFEDPIQEYLNVVSKLNPKVIVDTSDFTHYFIGHYEEYMYEGNKIDKKTFRKKFYEKVSENYYLCSLTGHLWNSKPKIFIKRS